MIHLPLSLYSRRGVAADAVSIVVGNDDEGGRVSLTLDFDRGDIANRPGEDYDAVRAITTVEALDESVTTVVPAYVARTLATKLVEARDALQDLYTNTDGLTLDRDLQPAEARALAAMLVHFADEAEGR